MSEHSEMVESMQQNFKTIKLQVKVLGLLYTDAKSAAWMLFQRAYSTGPDAAIEQQKVWDKTQTKVWDKTQTRQAWYMLCTMLCTMLLKIKEDATACDYELPTFSPFLFALFTFHPLPFVQTSTRAYICIGSTIIFSFPVPFFVLFTLSQFIQTSTRAYICTGSTIIFSSLKLK